MAQGMLREERPEHHLKIHLLDPHTYSMVFGWYLCEMARKLKNGAEISHVIRELKADGLHGDRSGPLQPEADEKRADASLPLLLLWAKLIGHFVPIIP